MHVIAHVSDTHLDLTPENHRRFTMIVRALQRASSGLDAVVFTGDVSDHAIDDEYHVAAAGLADIDVPVLICPGNHDGRDAFSRVLGVPRHPSSGFLNGRLDLDGLTLLALDSLVEGDDAGVLHEDTLRWLERQLEEAPSPVLLGLHHPPVTVGHPVVDGYRLRNASDLERVVQRHENVLAVLAGHAHTAASTTFAGRPLLLAPGVASTLRLPLGGHAELGPLTETTSAPGFALHFIRGRHVVTHYRMFDE